MTNAQTGWNVASDEGDDDNHVDGSRRLFFSLANGNQQNEFMTRLADLGHCFQQGTQQVPWMDQPYASSLPAIVILISSKSLL
jgi:hypothetical protein